MKKFLAAAAAVVVMGTTGTVAEAAIVYCPGVLGGDLTRQVVVTGALDGGYCSYKDKNLKDSDIAALGLTLIEKDEIPAGPDSGNLHYTVNGNTLDTPGTWTTNAGMWSTYQSLYIAFHFGNGSGSPDSFIVQLERSITTGTYNLVPVDDQNGLSNIYLLGRGLCTTADPCDDEDEDPPPPPLPEPTTMFLVGAGLLGLATRMRGRRQ